MKPLVYWCRWHHARLRLQGRDETAVWGELVFEEGDRPFRFDLKSWQLTVGEGEGKQVVRLDEMGVELRNGNDTVIN